MQTKFKVISLFLSLFFVLSFNQFAEASNIVVVMDGNVKVYNPGPQVIGGKTLVPMRGMFESLGATVAWDGSKQLITARGNNKTILLTIGKKEATVDGVKVPLEVPAQISKGSTFVPLRFVSEALGAEVRWDGNTKSIYIQTKGKKLTTAEIAKKQKSVVAIKTFDQEGQELSSGSGFIVDTKGWIVTNYHVIHGAYTAEVYLADGKKFPVEGIMTYDNNRDTALIKIEASNLPTVKLGSSGEVQIGEEIVAIGSPIGIQNTVSNGLVSQVRTVGKNKFLQISAPISQGSSGGALFNLYGEVVGITTSGYVFAQNINLAIPIDEVKPMLKEANLRNLADVAKEVEIGTEELNKNLAQRLYEAHKVIPVGGQEAELGGTTVFFSYDYAYEANINLFVDGINNQKIEEFIKQGKQGEIQTWIETVIGDAFAALPSELISGNLFYIEEFTYYPSWMAKEYVFPLEGGGYYILYPIVSYDGYYNNANEIVFDFYWD